MINDINDMIDLAVSLANDLSVFPPSYVYFELLFLFILSKIVCFYNLIFSYAVALIKGIVVGCILAAVAPKVWNFIYLNIFPVDDE